MTQSAFKSRTIAALLAGLALSSFAREGAAGLPEMEETLAQRAEAEWFDQCPDGSTTGEGCQGTVCGVDFVLDPAGVQRFITIDGRAWDLHSGDGEDLAVAGLLNAVCNGTAAMTTSPTGLQSVLGDDFMRQGLTRRRAGTVGTDPGPLLGAGAALELGSNGAKSGMVPISYAHSFSRDQFANLNGVLSYALLSQGGLFALNAVPSFGMLGGDSRLNWGLGAYAPLAFAYSSYSVLDYSLTGYDVGVGGVGILNMLLGQSHLSGGAVIDARHSSTSGSRIPLTALVRVLHPVSIVDAFGSLAFGSDPVHRGTTSATVRLGAEWGEWEFGYQLSLATGYTGHMLGFMYRQHLKRREILQRPAGAPPSAEPKPTEPKPSQPRAPSQPPAAPPPPASPPPPAPPAPPAAPPPAEPAPEQAPPPAEPTPPPEPAEPPTPAAPPAAPPAPAEPMPPPEPAQPPAPAQPAPPPAQPGPDVQPNP